MLKLDSLLQFKTRFHLPVLTVEVTKYVSANLEDFSVKNSHDLPILKHQI